jgi:hypothetical protein
MSDSVDFDEIERRMAALFSSPRAIIGVPDAGWTTSYADTLEMWAQSAYVGGYPDRTLMAAAADDRAAAIVAERRRIEDALGRRLSGGERIVCV